MHHTYKAINITLVKGNYIRFKRQLHVGLHTLSKSTYTHVVSVRDHSEAGQVRFRQHGQAYNRAANRASNPIADVDCGRPALIAPLAGDVLQLLVEQKQAVPVTETT